MDNIPSEMLRGHIDTIILLCLLDSDKHTSQIKEEIEERAGGDFQLKQGTFYSCLQRIVKQGYVTEYRTSNTPDGVRRKYFQLTEKGKIYIDENKDKWAYSRQVINTLILTPESDLTEKPKKPQTKETVQKETPDVATSDPQEEQSPEQSLNEFLNAQMDESAATAEKPQAADQHVDKSKPTKKNKQPENYDFFNYIDYTQSQFFTESDEGVQEVGESIAEKAAESDQTIERKIETVKIDEKKEQKTELPTKNQEEKPQQEASVTKPAQQQNVYEEGEVDDFFVPDGNIATDYKTVLSKLLGAPANKEEPTKPQNNQSVVADYNEGFDVNNFFSDGSKSDDDFDDRVGDDERETRKKHPKKPKTASYRTQNDANYSSENETIVRHPYYDFSDVISLADKEGFKVKISTRESMKEPGRILIGKLQFHSSLMFFAILLIETLIMYFATSSVAKLGFGAYALFLGAAALFPLVTGLNYLINKDKKVAKIPSFKSAIELTIVIMLNLVLIVIVCCVLSNINFSDQPSVMKYVIYPALVIIDLPIYVFIKYIRLDKNNYYA